MCELDLFSQIVLGIGFTVFIVVSLILPVHIYRVMMEEPNSQRGEDKMKKGAKYIAVILTVCKKESGSEITDKEHEELTDAVIETIEKLGFIAGGSFSLKTEEEVLSED